MCKYREVNDLSICKTPCVTNHQKAIVFSCVLKVCVLFHGVLVCERACTALGPAVVRGEQPERVA